jgi:hypothetical protein
MQQVDLITSKWKHWRYKNTGLLLISLAIFFFLSDTPFAKNTISYIGDYGYIGAFFVGMLFVSAFTVAPAIVVLFFMAKTLNPLAVSLIAGAGGVIGDYLIFKFFKDRVFEELYPLFIDHGGKPVRKLFRTPYFGWLVPIVGAIIIASPFPDELGIMMMGLSKVKQWQFLIITFVLDVLAVFLVVVAARSF